MSFFIFPKSHLLIKQSLRLATFCLGVLGETDKVSTLLAVLTFILLAALVEISISTVVSPLRRDLHGQDLKHPYPGCFLSGSHRVHGKTLVQSLSRHISGGQAIPTGATFLLCIISEDNQLQMLTACIAQV